MSKPKTITIDDVEYVRKSDVKSEPINFSSKNHPYVLGGMYCVRTVTMIQTGRLVAVFDNELVLEDAAWIADTGRFSDFLKGEVVNEVEPFNEPVVINRGSIIDVTKIPKLFLDRK